MTTMTIAIPDSLRESLESLARDHGISPAECAIQMLTAHTRAALVDRELIRRRAAERMAEFLALVPNVPPDPWDRLD